MIFNKYVIFGFLLFCINLTSIMIFVFTNEEEMGIISHILSLLLINLTSLLIFATILLLMNIGPEYRSIKLKMFTTIDDIKNTAQNLNKNALNMSNLTKLIQAFTTQQT